MRSVAERLQHHSIRRGDCLIWCGVSNHLGYGHMSVKGKHARVHRVAWELAYGPIPTGLFVLHICDVPPCIEPEHFRLGTSADNSEDSVRAGTHAEARKTHCKRGHPFDEENTYYRPSGGRDCRACHRGWDWKRGSLTGAGLGHNAAITHCPAGHPYSEDNTYRDRHGWRTCRTCRRVRERISPG